MSMPQPDTVKGFQSFYQDPDTARQYDRDRAHTMKQVIVRARERDLILAQLPSVGRILEIGCGTGAITAHLPERAQVIAFDSSEAMLSEARVRLADHPNVTLLNADLFTIADHPAFGRQQPSFDAAISARMFLHLAPDMLQSALTTVVPLLRRGAVLIFDLQRPNTIKQCLDHFEPHKVKNFRYTATDIEQIIGGFPELELEERIPFEHMIFLLPAVFLPAKTAVRPVVNTALAVDRALEPIELSANRWMVICRRK